MTLSADGTGFRGSAATVDSGTVGFVLSVATAAGTGAVSGPITGTAVGTKLVAGPGRAGEFAFGGPPDGPASIVGTVEKSGVASGALNGGVTHTFFPDLGSGIVYVCHNPKVSWKLTPQ